MANAHVNGVRLHYERTGDGAPPVVLGIVVERIESDDHAGAAGSSRRCSVRVPGRSSRVTPRRR